MRQHIAPDVLIVDGKPAPCRCTTKDGVKTICEFCAQANLIVWEREEARGPKLRPSRLLNSLRKLKQERAAEVLGVSDRQVRNILKSNTIPPKHAQRFYRNYGKGVSG